jgi:plasmid maintenance system antidote protein VapI
VTNLANVLAFVVAATHTRVMSFTDTYQQPLPKGDVLRALREGVGLSLRELADRINANAAQGQGRTVTHGHIGRVESGERPVTPRLAARIARVVADRMAGIDA